MKTYPDTEAVAEFMRTVKQPVRTRPTTDITDEERLLRVRLVMEEALEFAAAMGCTVTAPDSENPLRPKEVIVQTAANAEIDLVEAADALADIVVVTKGSAHTLGIPIDEAFEIVHRTNMAKAPGGVVRRAAGGKVIKPDDWVPPTQGLRDLLADPA